MSAGTGQPDQLHGHADEQLAAFALGTLPDGEAAAVERHVAHCARCAAELDATREVLALVALSAFSEPALSPSASIKESLLAEASRGGRLHRFAGRVAELLEVTIDKAKAALDQLDSAAAWSDFSAPMMAGISYQIPPSGPSLSGCAVAFLRLKPGARFPHHTHLADERVLTVQGGYLDERSLIEYGPGDLHEEHEGTSHSYRGLDGPDCFCLGVVRGHVKIGDQIF